MVLAFWQEAVEKTSLEVFFSLITRFLAGRFYFLGQSVRTASSSLKALWAIILGLH